MTLFQWLGRGITLLSLAILLSGCASTQYAVLEKVGIQKRDILVDRIEDAQSAQENTKRQFATAYELFSALIDVDAPELEAAYKKLSAAVEESEGAGNNLASRINKVESVAGDLFSEWEQELDLYSNQNLRKASERNMNQTRVRYQALLSRMWRAHARVEPVLHKLQDNVLYLKHNLNARAVNSLDNEVEVVQLEVGRLIQEMEAAIAESEAFLQSMQG